MAYTKVAATQNKLTTNHPIPPQSQPIHCRPLPTNPLDTPPLPPLPHPNQNCSTRNKFAPNAKRGMLRVEHSPLAFLNSRHPERGKEQSKDLRLLLPLPFASALAFLSVIPLRGNLLLLLLLLLPLPFFLSFPSGGICFCFCRCLSFCHSPQGNLLLLLPLPFFLSFPSGESASPRQH